MTQTRQTVDVTFRLEGDDDSIVAIFPRLESNYGRCVCYAHIGQHGECSFGYYRTTRPASPDQYAELLAELERIYDDCTLRVVSRIPYSAWCAA